MSSENGIRSRALEKKKGLEEMGQRLEAISEQLSSLETKVEEAPRGAVREAIMEQAEALTEMLTRYQTRSGEITKEMERHGEERLRLLGALMREAENGRKKHRREMRGLETGRWIDLIVAAVLGASMVITVLIWMGKL